MDCQFTERLCTSNGLYTNTPIVVYYPKTLIPVDLDYRNFQIQLFVGVPNLNECEKSEPVQKFPITDPVDINHWVNSSTIQILQDSKLSEIIDSNTSVYLQLADEYYRKCIFGPSINGSFFENVPIREGTVGPTTTIPVVFNTETEKSSPTSEAEDKPAFIQTALGKSVAIGVPIFIIIFAFIVVYTRFVQSRKYGKPFFGSPNPWKYFYRVKRRSFLEYNFSPNNRTRGSMQMLPPVFSSNPGRRSETEIRESLGERLKESRARSSLNFENFKNGRLSDINTTAQQNRLSHLSTLSYSSQRDIQAHALPISESYRPQFSTLSSLTGKPAGYYNEAAQPQRKESNDLKYLNLFDSSEEESRNIELSSSNSEKHDDLPIDDPYLDDIVQLEEFENIGKNLLVDSDVSDFGDRNIGTPNFTQTPNSLSIKSTGSSEYIEYPRNIGESENILIDKSLTRSPGAEKEVSIANQINPGTVISFRLGTDPSEISSADIDDDEIPLAQLMTEKKLNNKFSFASNDSAEFAVKAKHRS